MLVAPTPRTKAISPVYELRASHPLPVIDCARSVKDVIFSPRWLARCNYILHKSRRVLAFLFPVSCVAGWICPFAVAHTGRVMGLLLLLLQSAPLVAMSLVLSYDIVVLLAHTYEFWYLTLINWTMTTLGCFKYGDIRASATFLAFIGYENALLIDATHRGTQNTAVLSVLSGIVLIGYGWFMAFELIDEVRHIVLFSHGNWYVEGGDVIINCVTTIIVMLMRNAYRKRQRLSVRQNGETPVIRCITYRCRVRLDSLTSPTPSMLPLRIDATSSLAQLRLARPGQTFHSDDLLCNAWSKILATDQQRSRGLQVAYNIGSLTTALVSLISVVHPRWKLLSSLATALSGLHLAFTLSICQRKLLRKLLSSFDVAFISIQLTLMFLSLSHLQHWDQCSVVVLNCWMWVHWVLLLDAITPVTKSAVGIQHGLAVLVVGLLILGQVLVAIDLVFLQRWQLKDRILFIFHVGPRTLQVRTASFMLSRMFSLFWWCWRLLWRLMTRMENELIFIQEVVEYDAVRRMKGQRGKLAGTTPAVQPKQALPVDLNSRS